MKTLVAKKQPFKGIENYFIDALYQDAFDASEQPAPNTSDSGDEADTESGSEYSESKNVNWDGEPIVISLEGLDVNNVVPSDGEWIINEDLKFDCSSGADSEPSSTGTDVVSDCLDKIYFLASFQAPIRSSFHKQSDNDENAVETIFEIPPKDKIQKLIQKLILFERANSESQTKYLDSEEQENPEFFHYDENSHKLMRKMGYDLANGRRLKFEKGRRAVLQPFIPK